MNGRLHVFVYGTLREKGVNHHYLKGANLIDKNVTINGSLFDTQLGYPIYRSSNDNTITGEIYEINDSILAQLDYLEGFQEERLNNDYERTIIKIALNQREEWDIYIYEAGALFSEQTLPLIKCGDWIHYIEGNGQPK